MRLILSPETFPVQCRSAPEIGEDYVPYRSGCSNQHRQQDCRYPFPGEARLGKVPHVFATLANAPVALEGYLSLSNALSRGRLTAHEREILALAVVQ